MKIAIVGSRTIKKIDVETYLPRDCSEIVSGGAIGVDRFAAVYVREHGIKLTEFYPIYEKYGRGALILRNRQIVEYADQVLVFWDGKSKGTLFVMRYCEETRTPYRLILCL